MSDDGNDNYWPVSDGRCPKCGRYVGGRTAHVVGELGRVTGVCRRDGEVELSVIGWSNGEDFYA